MFVQACDIFMQLKRERGADVVGARRLDRDARDESLIHQPLEDLPRVRRVPHLRLQQRMPCVELRHSLLHPLAVFSGEISGSVWPPPARQDADDRGERRAVAAAGCDDVEDQHGGILALFRGRFCGSTRGCHSNAKRGAA